MNMYIYVVVICVLLRFSFSNVVPALPFPQ
jgi:hypothetical protein